MLTRRAARFCTGVWGTSSGVDAKSAVSCSRNFSSLKENGQQFQCPKQRATAQLLLGVADNNAQEVERVLQQGVDLDSRNEHNETALRLQQNTGIQP